LVPCPCPGEVRGAHVMFRGSLGRPLERNIKERRRLCRRSQRGEIGTKWGQERWDLQVGRLTSAGLRAGSAGGGLVRNTRFVYYNARRTRRCVKGERWLNIYSLEKYCKLPLVSFYLSLFAMGNSLVSRDESGHTKFPFSSVILSLGALWLICPELPLIFP
jgi:hypothetical protein